VEMRKWKMPSSPGDKKEKRRRAAGRGSAKGEQERFWREGLLKEETTCSTGEGRKIPETSHEADYSRDTILRTLGKIGPKEGPWPN